jgi:signal transduction histidine kinase
MEPHAAERRHLERQITYARPIFLVLALGDLLAQPPRNRGEYAVPFVFVYLGIALGLLLMRYVPAVADWRAPLVADLAALAVFLLLSRSTAAFWFLYLFVALAVGIRWGMERAILIGGVVTLAVLLRAALQGGFGWVEVLSWIALVVGTFTGGVGLSFLGDWQRRHAAEHEFLSRLTQTLRVEQGVTESLRLLLTELARGFDCDRAIFAFRDAEMERIFVWSVSGVWSVRGNQDEHISPENLPPTRSDALLLDCPEASICWNQMEGAGAGFGWDRRDGRALATLPRMPNVAREEFGLRSMLAVTCDFGGQPVGRIILGNARRRLLAQDLGALDRAVRHLGTPLENLFLLRRLRTRAIEGERSRISRDIHDGILQTLLSVDIQLDVLRRKTAQAPDQAVAALVTLQQTVRNETEELRRMVTDMRPLGVQSADLVDLMRGFAERFRNESGPALDLLIDAAALQVPDRMCRELFQIYREALHNVKKHARATHVVVKLWQNESQVSLVIDDNGEGFSFAGRFTGDELDRLRLGPISIKERTRSVGGVLTVESTPGHGARLTVEIPLG